MNLQSLTIVASIVLFTGGLASGCASDSILGTWTGDEPGEGSIRIEFTGDETGGSTTLVQLASGRPEAGCTTQTQGTGDFVVSGERLQVTWRSGSSVVSGCADETLNVTREFDAETLEPGRIDSDYVLTAESLSFTQADGTRLNLTRE